MPSTRVMNERIALAPGPGRTVRERLEIYLSGEYQAAHTRLTQVEEVLAQRGPASPGLSFSCSPASPSSASRRWPRWLLRAFGVRSVDSELVARCWQPDRPPRPPSPQTIAIGFPTGRRTQFEKAARRDFDPLPSDAAEPLAQPSYRRPINTATQDGDEVDPALVALDDGLLLTLVIVDRPR